MDGMAFISRANSSFLVNNPPSSLSAALKSNPLFNNSTHPFSHSYSLRGCEIWTPTEYLESRSKSWKLLVGKSVSTSVSDILQYTNTIQCRYKFDCLKGLAFVKICCISHAIILINFEVRWGSIILTLINRLLDLDHQSIQGGVYFLINPGARLIYSLVSP